MNEYIPVLDRSMNTATIAYPNRTKLGDSRAESHP